MTTAARPLDAVRVLELARSARRDDPIRSPRRGHQDRATSRGDLRDGRSGGRRDVLAGRRGQDVEDTGRIGPVPTPGQHTDEIISSALGYDSGAPINPRSAGAIA